jgi:hypothetical protein
VRSLDVAFHAIPPKQDLVERIARAPLTRAIRRLALGFAFEPRGVPFALDTAFLGSLAGLRHLTLRGAHVESLELPLLETLDWAPTSTATVPKLLARGAFPRLRSLALDLVDVGHDLPHPSHQMGLLDVFHREATPELDELEIRRASDETVRGLLAMLARSKLLPRLKKLALGWREIEPPALRPRYGAAFDHLDKITLPFEPT